MTSITQLEMNMTSGHLVNPVAIEAIETAAASLVNTLLKFMFPSVLRIFLLRKCYVCMIIIFIWAGKAMNQLRFAFALFIILGHIFLLSYH